MNQLLVDGRSLAGIVASIIRQDDLRIMYSRLDWERMYRMADYHKVANIVYLGILGHRESLPEKWQELFFKRYQESLLLGENYTESLKEVLTWLDMRKISCTLLVSETVRELYRIPEMAYTGPLQIYLDEKSYSLVKGYLIDLGYEVVQEYDGIGEHFERISGIPIMLYYKLPFRTTKYVRGMQRLLESACMKGTYKYIRALPIESEFVFRMASAAYHYATDELTMREVLDLQLCHRAWRDRIRVDVIQRKLSEYKINGLAEKILRISYMWFGDRMDTYYEGLPDEMSEYDRLEERLLTRGMIRNESDVQALNLEKLIRREIEKEKRKEERRLFREKMKERWNSFKKILRWVFPDFHYMASIYPTVEKVPVLLPIFWVIRDIRLLRRAIKG